MIRLALARTPPTRMFRPTPPVREHGDRASGLHFRRVQHGADAGHDRTADESGAVERHVRPNRDRL